MRLATLRASDGATTAAVERGDGWYALDSPDVGALLQRPDWREVAAAADGPTADEPRFGVLLPAPAKVICCGHNYAGHIAEMGHPTPTAPNLFTKFADTLCGPDDDIVVDDPAALVDWEAELAIVIGAPLPRGAAAPADAIAGYTVANDVSLRDRQRRASQWLPGKAFDASTPVGPVLVTADDVDPAAGLAIRCWLGGELVQSASTDDLVFDAAALLAAITEFTTLRPGDLVLTGTPSGVGTARTPPRYLADGDVLRTAIDGIGTLTNRIRITARPTKEHA